jgi:hypothetical protein
MLTSPPGFRVNGSPTITRVATPTSPLPSLRFTDPAAVPLSGSPRVPDVSLYLYAERGWRSCLQKLGKRQPQADAQFGSTDPMMGAEEALRCRDGSGSICGAIVATCMREVRLVKTRSGGITSITFGD